MCTYLGNPAFFCQSFDRLPSREMMRVCNKATAVNFSRSGMIPNDGDQVCETLKERPARRTRTLVRTPIFGEALLIIQLPK